MQHVTTSVWTYRGGIMEPGVAPRNVVRYGVEARDGSIGKVDDATYEVGSSYLVVKSAPGGSYRPFRAHERTNEA